MTDNLIQKIIKGKYSQKELKEIEDAVKYAQQTYQIVEDKIDQAQHNEYKCKSLEEIEKKINTLNEQLTKVNKKQAKYLLYFISLCFPIICTLCIISAFNPVVLIANTLLSTASVAVGSVPLAILDIKRKKLISEIQGQEQNRVKILSDICFEIPSDYVKNLYNNQKKSNNIKLEVENKKEESVTL